MPQGDPGEGAAAIRRHIGIVLHDTGNGGGTERIARRLGQALARAGRSPVLLMGDARGAERWQAEAEGDPVPVIASPVPIGRSDPRYMGRWVGRTAREERLDALVVPGNAHLPLLPSLARELTHRAPFPAGVDIGWRSTRVAVMATLSNPLTRRRSAAEQWAFERLTAHRLSSAHVVTAPSDGLLAEARRVVPHGRLHRLPIPALGDLVGPPPPPVAAPVVLGAGRLVPQKNFALLLDALALCPLDTRAILTGDGPQRWALERRARRRDLAGRVRFTGPLPTIDGPLAAARLLAISSDYESGPAVLMEALAAGRAVVSTRCAPSLDEWPASHVELVPVGDASALAAALTRRLAAPPPPPVGEAVLAQHRIGAAADRVAALLDAVPMAAA